MRPGGTLRLSALAAIALSVALAGTAVLSFRAALSAKIDRAGSIERDAARPAAAARLAAALLERRLAAVTESSSHAVASAFRRADASKELADYRAAGGDPAVVADAEKALALSRSEPDSDIALMRAIRKLRSESDRLVRPSRPPVPAEASRATLWIAAACACSALAALLGYAAGRTARNP